MQSDTSKFALLVRVGYAARGLVYVLLGYLALSSAASATAGAEASLDMLRQIPLGTVVLYATSLGLLAYAIYKLVSAIADVERHGSDAKGIAQRVGYFASAVAHGVLARTAFQFARGDKRSPSGEGSDQAASTLLTWDLGAVILGLVGIGFLLGAAFQARSAITAHFMRSVGAEAPPAVCWIGRIGHASRAIVFLVIGWSLVRSAWFADGAEVKGLGDALSSLRDNGTLYTLVAAGLLLFGLFSLIVAYFRIIPEVSASQLTAKLHR